MPASKRQRRPSPGRAATCTSPPRPPCKRATRAAPEAEASEAALPATGESAAASHASPHRKRRKSAVIRRWRAAP
ncbi:hypothetical protein IMCC26134_04935 [Verrucomicrobia bacterium IMCC26134]|nr:hypothetical protein IMCC26134_04935 [Verrucomicrobia bacterium IMCC26134]